MRQSLSPRRQGVLLAALTAVISGFAVFVNGYGVRAWAEVADATTYTTLKNLFAAVVIGVFAAIVAMRGSPQRPALPKGARQRSRLAAIAVVGGSVPFVLFFEGLSRATSTQAAFIHKTLVIWVAILAMVFLKERIGWPHMTAIAVLVWGQVMLAGPAGLPGFGVGEIMILAATLLWSIELVIAKRVLGGVSFSTVAGARMIGGSAVLVAWALIRGVSVDWSALAASHWGWILVTGVLLSGFVLTWFAALSMAPAVDVTAVLVAGAVITALLQTTVRQVALPDPVGLALIAGGAALVGIASWRRGMDRS